MALKNYNFIKTLKFIYFFYLILLIAFISINLMSSISFEFVYGDNIYSEGISCKKNIFSDSSKFLNRNLDTVTPNITSNPENIFCLGNLVFTNENEFLGVYEENIIVVSKEIFFISIFFFLYFLYLFDRNFENNNKLLKINFFLFINFIYFVLIFPAGQTIEMFVIFILIHHTSASFLKIDHIEKFLFLCAILFIYINPVVANIFLFFLIMYQLSKTDQKYFYKSINIVLSVGILSFLLFSNESNLILKIILLLDYLCLKIYNIKPLSTLPFLNLLNFSTVLAFPFFFTFSVLKNKNYIFGYIIGIFISLLLYKLTNLKSNVLIFLATSITISFLAEVFKLSSSFLLIFFLTFLVVVSNLSVKNLENPLIILYILFLFFLIPFNNLLSFFQIDTTKDYEASINFGEEYSGNFENIVYILFDGLNQENANFLFQNFIHKKNFINMQNSISSGNSTRTSLVDIFSGKIYNGESEHPIYVKNIVSDEAFITSKLKNYNVNTHTYTNNFNISWTNEISDTFENKYINRSFRFSEILQFPFEISFQLLKNLHYQALDFSYLKPIKSNSNIGILNIILNSFPVQSVSSFKDFEKYFLENESKYKTKDFYFIHLTIPHPPYVLDKDCSYKPDLKNPEETTINCALKLLNDSEIFDINNPTLYIIGGDHTLVSPDQYGWNNDDSLEWKYEEYFIERLKTGLIIGTNFLNQDLKSIDNYFLPNLYNLIYDYFVYEKVNITNEIKTNKLYFLYPTSTFDPPYIKEININKILD